MQKDNFVITSENKDENPILDTNSGEINWDCPCLKSALEPPCGDVFKEAFSCFVKSKTDPKGLDCNVQFLAMQKCYAENEEIYKNRAKQKE